MLCVDCKKFDLERKSLLELFLSLLLNLILAWWKIEVSVSVSLYFFLNLFVKAGETTAGEMMAGDNEPSQNDDDLDIVNEDTNQGNPTSNPELHNVP